MIGFTTVRMQVWRYFVQLQSTQDMVKMVKNHSSKDEGNTQLNHWRDFSELSLF